jgi:hypothetical protein
LSNECRLAIKRGFYLIALDRARPCKAYLLRRYLNKQTKVSALLRLGVDTPITVWPWTGLYKTTTEITLVLLRNLTVLIITRKRHFVNRVNPKTGLYVTLWYKEVL